MGGVEVDERPPEGLLADPEAGLLGLVVCAKATVAIMVAPATTARAAGKCMDLSPMMRRNINA